jgi:pimeloyl-ACP methyl ester carboxylesterase
MTRPKTCGSRSSSPDSEQSPDAGRAFLKRYLSRTENPDAPIGSKVAPAQIAAITQPTRVVNGKRDVIVYTLNSLHLVQNMPNAKQILYPDSNHGSWYQNHEDFAFEANRFLS